MKVGFFKFKDLSAKYFAVKGSDAVKIVQFGSDLKQAKSSVE